MSVNFLQGHDFWFYQVKSKSILRQIIVYKRSITSGFPSVY